MIKNKFILFIIILIMSHLHITHAEKLLNDQEINQTQAIKIQIARQAKRIKQQQQALKQRLDVAIRNLPAISLEKL